MSEVRRLLDCSVQVPSQLCSTPAFFPPMATPVHRPGLRSHRIVEPTPPTKSRKQVATEKKAEKEAKEQKKNEGLKKIATVENAKAQEQEASTKHHALPCRH